MCGTNTCLVVHANARPKFVHGFWPKSDNFDFGKKMIPYERASQEEQNGANFSFTAPSTVE